MNRSAPKLYRRICQCSHGCTRTRKIWRWKVNARRSPRAQDAAPVHRRFRGFRRSVTLRQRPGTRRVQRRRVFAQGFQREIKSCRARSGESYVFGSKINIQSFLRSYCTTLFLPLITFIKLKLKL